MPFLVAVPNFELEPREHLKKVYFFGQIHTTITSVIETLELLKFGLMTISTI